MVWFGHSPDRRRKVEVLQARNKLQTVKVDGKAGRPYDGVGVGALVFSPDSRRLAYPAQRGHGWHVVINGEEGEPFGGIGEIVFSPDSRHVAYLARRGGRWHVVRDGKVGAPFYGVFRRTLTFSADSKRLASVVMAAPGKAQVVVDGKKGPVFSQVAGLTFSADSRRVAYIGRDKGRARVVVDGKPGPIYDDVSEVALGKGSRVAYLARRLRAWIAVVNGQEGKARDGAAGLVYSPDGERVAFAALKGEQTFVVLDGVEGPRHDGIRVPTLTFTASGHLLYVARRLRRGGVLYTAVHDGKAGQPFLKIRSLQATPAGRWGYIGEGAKDRVVLDGKPGAGAPWVANLVLGPRGRRHAFLTRKDKQVELVVVTDGKARRHRFDVVVRGSVIFSDDGAHWGCLAGDREPRRLYMVVDGRTAAAFDREELTAAMMADPRRSEATLLRRWVAAELALAVGTQRTKK